MKAVLFDFDGLLLDTETPEFLSWQEVYDGHGCTLAMEAWVANIGLGSGEMAFSPYAELSRQLGREIDRAAIRASRRARFAELMRAESLMPGAAERLEEAGKLGMKTAIVSSSPRAWIEEYLERFGLIEAFDAIVSCNDVTCTKPDPEPYRTALERLAVLPAEAVAFEDSSHGIASAKRAGIRCIAVPNRITRHCDLSAADRVVESLGHVTLAGLEATLTEVMNLL